jgi:short-subunit dehydrogenase
VLVNNAGFGLLGAIEESSDADVRRMYDTNVFGLLKRYAEGHRRKERLCHAGNRHVEDVVGID